MCMHPFRTNWFHSLDFTRRTRRQHAWHLCLPNQSKITGCPCASTNKRIPIYHAGPIHTALTSLREHEQAKSYVNRMWEQNHRLTTGLSAVFPRLISGTRSALRSWMLTSRPSPFCLCKPFSSQGCPGKKVDGRVICR